MPRFGSRSRRRLRGVDARLVSVLNEVVKHYDITVLEGKRSEERQHELVRKGASKTMKSKHLEGKAVDIAPYPVPNWEDTYQFIYMAGRVMQEADRLGVDLRYGGDWDRDETVVSDQKFQDLVHFEIYEK
jgi:peptidoglycan L-alanyl-D-glutamate endopeptidase CwlK|tara:strand:- start:947 stop:1336 length:390 start_codon:yes stop_codon:yes gene_type:complete